MACHMHVQSSIIFQGLDFNDKIIKINQCSLTKLLLKLSYANPPTTPKFPYFVPESSSIINQSDLSNFVTEIWKFWVSDIIDQYWKSPQVHRSKANNFGVGAGIFVDFS